MRSRFGLLLTSHALVVALLVGLCCVVRITVADSLGSDALSGNGLRIVDASDSTKTTPVVNEGGKVTLKVVDGSGNSVAVQSWSTDNKSVGKVNKKKVC